MRKTRSSSLALMSGVRLSRSPARFEKLLSIQQMDSVIRRETSRADRNGHEFSLVLFRIKRSKRHSLSTHRLIRTVVSRARATDEVGWFGDRHVCVVLPDTPLAGAWIFADSVCDLAAKRIPRPVAIVYCYPGNWFTGTNAQSQPAAQPAEHPRLTGAADLAAAADRRGLLNEDDDHDDDATGSSGGNGNGHGRRNGHTNGNGSGRLVLSHRLEQVAGNGNGNGHTNGNGHSNGNGNGHALAGAVATKNAAAPTATAEHDRDALLPYFVTGLNTGLNRTGLAGGSVEMLLARPMPLWKRALDILGASVGILLTGWLMALAALGIKLTSPGPVMFLQKRAGLGGRPFTIYKFRTMCTDAEAKKKDLRKQSEQDGPAFKMKNDPRVTSIGKILRKTSIDELPQLFNVLKGDMSLVGPRPLPVDEAQACAGWQRRRLDVTPGLTCIWQIFGRSTVTFSEWVRMDVAYIRRRTIFHDLKLIFLTVPAVLMRKGAR